MTMNWTTPHKTCTRKSGAQDVLVRLGTAASGQHITIAFYEDMVKLAGIKQGDRVSIGYDDDMHIIGIKKATDGYILSAPSGNSKPTTACRVAVSVPKWVMDCKRRLLSYEHVNIAADGTIFIYPDKP